ncbi:MAG: nitrile hydratase subunit beta [Thermoleophilaceae bacterium]
MNGAHDVGGMHGFGPVVAEADEPVFHADWERDAFAVLMAGLAQGVASTDENRFAIESIGNVEYLTTSYFEHWLRATEDVLVAKGVIAEDERRERVAAVLADPDRFARPAARERDDLARRLLEVVATGGPTSREIDRDPRFAVGDAVRTVDRHPAGHTRLPRYARGKPATVVASHGAHVFPDANAHGLGERPQPLYTIRLEARDLWGDGRAGEAVHVDAWESYLVPPEGRQR